MSGPDLLETIVAATRARVAAARSREPLGALEGRALARAPRGSRFRQELERVDRINVIAECKRRSPSRGVLRVAYDAVDVAAGYASAGAAALSVLTEPMFFDGSLEHLSTIREAVSLPLLRKDFIVEEYQLLEARAAGADAALLIVSALNDQALRHLHARCLALDMAALVEVHSAAELDRAVDAGAGIVGVNNRNLRTLEVDVNLSHAIAARLPKGIIAVSESGLKSPADLQSLRAAGYRGFLIGERFMTSADPGRALSGLLQAAEAGVAR
jgi:indole-3-glycerol phosphate synthase